MTQDELKKILHYDPLTGIFTWLVKPSQAVNIGDTAGYINSSTGHMFVGINNRTYALHRLAWFYMKGYWPKLLDHEDRIRHNNVWTNLREATYSQNCQNASLRKDNTSGIKGVCWHKESGKWQARISHENKRYCLGRFNSIEEAQDAIESKRAELHGNFACRG